MTAQVISESSNRVTAQVIDSTVHHIKNTSKNTHYPIMQKAPLTLKIQFRPSPRKKGDRNVMYLCTSSGSAANKYNFGAPYSAL